MQTEFETLAARPVRIAAGGVELDADLTIPAKAKGLVVFAHGSGSSRHSSRNISVARELHRAELATLLLDLLTSEEERIDAVTAEYRFDIPMLAQRVSGAVDWAQAAPATAALPLGLFGASTGAAAALISAARRPSSVRAVVSRGGRADLADNALEHVTAPTLLIVGERDEVVIQLNEAALRRIKAPAALEIVPGATHLFEEPGALSRVASLAAGWFVKHLP